MEPTNKYIDIRELLDGYKKFECEQCGKEFYREITGVFNTFLSNSVCRKCGEENINRLKKKAEEILEEQANSSINKMGE